jgi:tRNA-2-methylthio-N6-dimethylallyladenosine synthase
MGSEKKGLAVLTFGCQMNEYDSERIGGLLSQEGFQLTENLEEARVVLLNTCSIREKAEQKFYSQLGRLAEAKRKSPSMIIGVGGCIAQREGERIFDRASHVDLVFGTQNLGRLPLLLREVLQTKARVADVTPEEESEGPYPIRRECKVRAWVAVMQGCNNFCSYCVVPAVRGPQRSRPGYRILEEVKGLIRENYKEVTLLGQNVNAYGQDLPGETSFAALLSLINDMEGLERIRFVTSHPKDLSDELIDAMATLPKVCEHIHLPVQCGSNKILHRMNRGYRVEDYQEKIRRLRASIPRVGLSTDLIVGFPGEEEEDFAATRELVQTVQYDSIYLFKYSPRPETAAAVLPGSVPGEVKQERFQEILTIQREIALRKNQELEGTVVEVLVEGESKRDASKLTGRTRSNKIVNFYGRQDLVGRLVNLEIVKGKLYSLEGQLLN